MPWAATRRGRKRWPSLALLCAVTAVTVGSMALRPDVAGAAEGSGGGTGTTIMDNQPGTFCTKAVMTFRSDRSFRGTYVDQDGGTYSGPLEVELRPGAGGRVSQNPDGTLDADCTTGTAGYKYPIEGTIRSPNGAVSCTFGGPGSQYWRLGPMAYAELDGSCSVNGKTWPTRQSHTVETTSVDGTPPTRSTNHTTFVARDAQPRPPKPAASTTTTTTTTTTTLPPSQAPPEPPSAPTPEPSGPGAPAQVGQASPPGGGGTPAQPPGQQVVQQVQAQQAQLSAQPAAMLQHQRQLQVEKATIDRRDRPGQAGLLASARRAPSPVASAITASLAAAMMAGLAFGHRRQVERRLAPFLARARAASLPPSRSGRWPWRQR